VGSAGTDIDAVLTAANTIRTTAFVEPDTILIHPNDWSSTGFAAAKDSAGNYLLGSAVMAPEPRLWGMRVVQSTQVTENTLIVANLKVAARLYVRMRPTVEVQPHGGTAEFIANQTLVRAEERLFLAVPQPKAICLVTAV
jgi:HK97 family phage major capsid protein